MKLSAVMDNSGLKKLLRKVEKDVIPAATAAALNRTMKKAHTVTIRDIAAQTGIKQRILRGRIRFTLRDRALRSRLESKLYLVTSPLAVAYLGKPTQGKKGTRVKGVLYLRAFVATMKSGHTGVFVREPGAGGKGEKRPLSRKGTGHRVATPVEEIRKPIRAEIDRVAKATIDDVGIAEFQKRLDHEIRYRLNLVNR